MTSYERLNDMVLGMTPEVIGAAWLRLSSQLHGDLPGLSKLLDHPEAGVLSEHHLEALGDVARSDRKPVGLSAHRRPFFPREGDALDTVALPALAPETRPHVLRSHLGSPLIEPSRPSLVMRDALFT
jgi:hypothetical protein